MKAVGFIGLGDQGAPMARAVADGGYDLHVWARRPASLEALTGTTYTGARQRGRTGRSCGRAAALLA